MWRVCALSIAGSPQSAPRFQSDPSLILERKGRELFYPTFVSSLPTPHQAEIRKSIKSCLRSQALPSCITKDQGGGSQMGRETGLRLLDLRPGGD